MEVETVLMAAIQSSFILGLIHGVNPCGHSWLVLAPFVTGEKEGRNVAVYTTSFLAGTALACLVLGMTLGAVSVLIPEAAGAWVEGGTSTILIIIGLLLIYNPHILHGHDDHDHHQGHTAECCSAHDHHHGSSLSSRVTTLFKKRSSLPLMLFVVGFVNMIVPCPTAAVMYGYALNSGNTLAATIVFGTYAISTAIAVGVVIYLIFRITSITSTLQQDWIEPLVMRVAGLIIVIFSSYSLYHSIIG